MDKKVSTASNFIPESLLDIICILKTKSTIRTRLYGLKRLKNTLIVKFGAKDEKTTPLKNNASAQKQHVIRTRNKFLPKTSCVNQSERVGRKNLHVLLENSLQVNIRIRIEILPMSDKQNNRS